jgi:hypothetical protein
VDSADLLTTVATAQHDGDGSGTLRNDPPDCAELLPALVVITLRF